MSQASMTDFGSPSMNHSEPERTSILALLSMISSLICCIPGLSVLGTLMGIGALVSIGGSNGRVGGKGMAWTGIIVGILVTMIWGGIAIGGASVWSQIRNFLTDMEPEFRAMESGDYATARTLLTPTAQAAATDEAFAEFVAAYQADYGPLGAQVVKLGGMMEGLQNSAPVFESYQGDAMIPMVYETPGGPIAFVIVAKQSDLANSSNPDNPFKGSLHQISFMGADGTVVELVP